jgi:phage terminase large subunit-like protein
MDPALDLYDPDGPRIEDQIAAAALAEKAQKEKCRRDFIEFCIRFYPLAGMGIFKAGWVHYDIALRLKRFMQAVERGERPRLMLLMPPRHGKSSLVSVMFYCWCFGHHPEWQMFNVGYNEDLPLEFSKGVRQVLSSKAYAKVFPNTVIKRDDRAADHWRLTQGGGMRAAGLKGGITGHGANIMGIDDPLKGDEEADSQNTRDKLWSGYKYNIRTRLHPGGGILVVQTWWHDDDLAGRLIKLTEQVDEGAKYRDKFEIVRYPAMTDPGEWEYRDDDTLEIIRFRDKEDPPFSEDELDDLNYTFLRGPDEALHEDRYSWRELMSIKVDVEDRVWNALYQQNPIPDSGSFFTKEMLHYSPGLPNVVGTHVCTGWDLAIGELKQNNFTAGVTIQHHYNGTMFVRNVTKFKGDAMRIADAMVSEAKHYMLMPDPPYYTVAVEDGQIWKTAMPFVKAAFEAANLPWSVVVPYTAVTDKMARAAPMQDHMKRGLYKIWKGAKWIGDYIRELMKFPYTKDKDQVDASAWAVRHLLELGAPEQPEETDIPNADGWTDPNETSWKDKLSSTYNAGGRGGHMSA